MRLRILIVLVSGLFVLANVSSKEAKAQPAGVNPTIVDRAYGIDAPALSAIKIDGDLSDWPAALPRYSLRNLQPFPPSYGMGGLENVDLMTSPDLSACFTVGYNAEEGLIYVAVIVRDDVVVVTNKTGYDTDGVHLYVDGLRSDTVVTSATVNNEIHLNAADLPSVRYTGIPGPGPIFGEKAGTNSKIKYGDITKTKAKMAFSRNGDLTIYEWQVQAFDHFPDQPTKLEPGKRIGFDLAVIDKDRPVPEGGAIEPEGDLPVFLCWGFPPKGTKGFDAGNLGELILSP